MESLADELGSPVSVRVRNRDLPLRPLTLGALGEIERQAEQAAYDAAQKRIDWLAENNLADEATRRDIARQLFQDLDSGEAERKWSASHAGVVFTLWCCIRGDAPYAVTLHETSQAVDLANMEEIQERIKRVSFPRGPLPNARTPAANPSRPGILTQAEVLAVGPLSSVGFEAEVSDLGKSQG